MHPMQIRIGDVIARGADKHAKKERPEPKIAFVEDGNIYIEKISREVINDLPLL
jgi:septum site-determining protein MinC